ncbi:MAG TPA: beta-ketoacyl-ACP synthase II [Pseudomonadales bacterium]
MSKRRVVVTGLGMLSPIGNDVETSWKNALAGKSGARPIQSFDASGYSVRISAPVVDFDPEPYLDRKDLRRMDNFIQYGMVAGIQAIQDAGLPGHPADADRYGLAIGSGIGGINTIEETHSTLLNKGPNRVSPFFVPASVINMISGYLSIRYGYKGPNIAVVTACTTGTHNIGIGMRMIQHGDADVMVVGGAEQATSPITVAAFASMKALSTRNDEPERASRPWDKDRDGFLLGDGAGVLVLEEYERAKARGAKIYCEVAGFGLSGDAYHFTGPTEDGEGSASSMRRALQDAGMGPDDIDYINAHATSTPLGDVSETKGIKRIFGNDTKVAVNSSKSMIGHLLGAAGSVEAIFTILSIRDQVLHPTINLDEPGEGCDLDYVPHTARDARIRAALSNSFGFGGTNGTLLFKKI